MAYVPTLKTQYKEQIVPALMKEFGYTSVMQCPKLEKIVINQGMGQAVSDKKLIDVAQAELTQITGQKAVQTKSRKDISNFKLRRGMPIGVRVTLRRNRMYEFLERLIAVALSSRRHRATRRVMPFCASSAFLSRTLKRTNRYGKRINEGTRGKACETCKPLCPQA